MVTDKLRSYDAAKAEIAPGLEDHQHKGLNNRGYLREFVSASWREAHRGLVGAQCIAGQRR